MSSLLGRPLRFLEPDGSCMGSGIGGTGVARRNPECMALVELDELIGPSGCVVVRGLGIAVCRSGGIDGAYVC